MPSSAGLAAWLDSYQRALRDALDASARDGFRRIHANTVTGALDPAEFSHTARRHLSRHLLGLGLTLDGLAADFDGLGLADPRLAEQRLDHLRATLELARELRTPLALVNIGGFGDPRSEPLAIELLEQTAELADRFGVRIAVRDPIGASAALAGQLGRLRPHGGDQPVDGRQGASRVGRQLAVHGPGPYTGARPPTIFRPPGAAGRGPCGALAHPHPMGDRRPRVLSALLLG
ncbi:MAG TPA: hypothetical protein PKC49_01620, partial [Phycisphaerae bacterium]|nr:hypothetical protein [Phycisphaerae bacterium]